jgi:hypothetical protein
MRAVLLSSVGLDATGSLLLLVASVGVLLVFGSTHDWLSASRWTCPEIAKHLYLCALEGSN